MEKYTITLGEIIENNVNIFDFEYPFYSTERKPQFEKNFIEHFYFDEIGQETIARFKQRLKIKLNLIMPYWNKVFVADELELRILDNYDVTEETKTVNKQNIKSVNKMDSKNLLSSNPVTKTDIDNVDYVDSIDKNTGSNENTTNGENEQVFTRKIFGNYGVQTDSSAIVQYWDSLRKIEEEIFTDCDDLFMGVY